MKIELIKTFELDGNWYKIQVDGVTKIAVSISDEKKDFDRALEAFKNLVAQSKKLRNAELIKSVEI
jgi:hypothetical protein